MGIVIRVQHSIFSFLSCGGATPPVFPPVGQFYSANFQGKANDSSSTWGEDPIGNVGYECYLATMNMLLLIVVLLLLFGGGGFYFGGPLIGGSGLGLILMICLVVYLVGGFRTKT
jgi:hypothetical protein